VIPSAGTDKLIIRLVLVLYDQCRAGEIDFVDIILASSASGTSACNACAILNAKRQERLIDIPATIIDDRLTGQISIIVVEIV